MLLSPEVKTTCFGVLTKVSLEADMILHELLGEEVTESGRVSAPTCPHSTCGTVRAVAPPSACEETLMAHGSSQHQDIFGTFER